MSNEFRTIKNGKLEMTVTCVGAAIQSLIFHKTNGESVDMVLGYDTAEEYRTHTACLGAVPGRFANRIANASYTLNGKEYHLDPNENGNTLHGGFNGYHSRDWDFVDQAVDENGDPCIKLHLFSPDGDQGHPGNLDAYVTYVLTSDNVLKMIYEAKSDQDTLVNLTNHSYFNLSGYASGCIDKDHMVMIPADAYLPVDAGLIPTGEVAPVEGTRFDLREFGKFREVEGAEYLEEYDHAFVLRGPYGVVKPAGRIASTSTGIEMNIETDLPAIQFYTAIGLPSETGKGGTPYARKYAFCVETEFFPDAIHQPSFEQPVLKAGDTFHTQTSFAFSEAE